MNRIKSPVSMTMCVLLALLQTACIDLNQDLPLPDLDPSTPVGGNIVIFEISDVIEYSSAYDPDIGNEQFAGLSKVYDLGNDGVIDFTLTGVRGNDLLSFESFVKLRFNGEALSSQGSIFGESYANTRFLPADALVSGTANGVWATVNKPLTMAEDDLTISSTYNVNLEFPVGISYMPTRTKVGADYYYGWLEVIASDYEDGNPSDFFIISRFGVSQTPGLRIRMGQE